MMPRQPQELRATLGVPHIDVAILAPTRQARAIATRGHPTRPGWVHTTRPAVGAGCHVPYQHALQHGAAGQPLPIGTPGHAEEEGLGVVEVPDDLDTVPGGWVPQPNGIIPPGTCQQASIRTPRDAEDGPAMPTQQPGLRRPSSPCHLPEAYHGIPACTGELGAVRTPVDVVEGGRVALQDAQRLATLHLPQPQSAIVTAP